MDELGLDKLDRQILETIIKVLAVNGLELKLLLVRLAKEKFDARTSTNRSSFSRTSCTVRRRTYGYENSHMNT